MVEDCVPSFEEYKKKFPEFKENIECVENYLNLYDLYTIDVKNKNIERELYNETLKMIERGINTRTKQVNTFPKQMKELSEKLVKRYPNIFCIKDNKLERISDKDTDNWKDEWLANEIMNLQIAPIDDYLSSLKYISDVCKRNDTSESWCIETFMMASHHRGPYINLGCNIPYPDFILHPETPYHDIKEIQPIDVLSALMQSETYDSLNCIRNRKYI